MSYMFYYSTLVSIKLSYWNTKEVNNKKGMFNNSSYLTELPDEVANWDTSKVIDMSYMFFFYNKLIKLTDITKWNSINVNTIRGMFEKCESLRILPDISSWNTSNVVDMTQMLMDCYSLQYLPNISLWDTKNLSKKYGMFILCNKNLIIPDKFKQ